MGNAQLRRSADSIVPSPLPAQRNSRGEGRVRGGKFLSATRLGYLASTTLTVLLIATSVSEAKPPRESTSVSGRFAPAVDETIEVGTSFQREGWETPTTRGGKVTWPIGRPGEMASKLDVG